MFEIHTVFSFLLFFVPTRYFKENSPPASVKELATSESWLFLVAGSEPGSLFPLLFFGVKKDQESSIVVRRAFEEGGLQLFVGVLLSIRFGFAGLAG